MRFESTHRNQSVLARRYTGRGPECMVTRARSQVLWHCWPSRTVSMRTSSHTGCQNSRDITLPTKVHLVSATVFPVAMYGCESWTVKRAECRRIDAFELWSWRRLLRGPWTARRSNQSIPNEISPEYSVEGLML